MSHGETKDVAVHLDAHAGGAIAFGDHAHASVTNVTNIFPATRETPAVTPADLRAFYEKERNEIKRVLLEDRYSIEHAYVNLTIIDSVEQGETEEELVSFEEYFRPRTAIDIEEILKEFKLKGD